MLQKVCATKCIFSQDRVKVTFQCILKTVNVLALPHILCHHVDRAENINGPSVAVSYPLVPNHFNQ